MNGHVGGLGPLTLSEFGTLMTFEYEHRRGLVHTPDWMGRMARDRTRLDEFGYVDQLGAIQRSATTR